MNECLLQPMSPAEPPPVLRSIRPDRRSGKELILASKPFAQDHDGRSWWEVITTLVPLAAALTLAVGASVWWVNLPASILTGLLMVRLFIIYHDYVHGSILRGSRIAAVLMRIVGISVMSPVATWKHSHDDHHKNNSKKFGNALGTYPLWSTREYGAATRKERVIYRLVRNPGTIALGYLTVFWGEMGFRNLKRPLREHLDIVAAMLLHVGLIIVLVYIGIPALLFGYVIPMMIAGAMGTYLFYAQHCFPGMKLRHGPEWDYVYAALKSSSFMKMSRVMHWFTANIGYHHVHHLNSKIPFYRLPETMAAIEELQSPTTTSLLPWDVFRCLQLKLWDPKRDRLITFREYRRQSPVSQAPVRMSA